MQFARQAEEIVGTAREFYGRMATWSAHFAKVGKDLGKATDAYNKAVSSWEGRVLPQARRLDDMQISDNTAAQLEDLQGVDMALKAPTVIEDE